MHHGHSVEEIAAALLEAGPDGDFLSLDRTLNGGDIEDRIFSTLISSQQFDHFGFPPAMEASAAEDMLRKVVQTTPNLIQVDMAMEMNESEAERILSLCRMSPTLDRLGVFLGNTTDGIARPLSKHLCESLSLSRLGLLWCRHGETNAPITVSETAVTSICAGIGESTSLILITVWGAPVVEDAQFVADSLARATAASSSLDRVKINSNPRAFVDQFRVSLMNTEAVRNFDLCFGETDEQDFVQFKLNRSAPWKPLLSQEVPLNYWPSILAKTNTWTEETSHRPSDALYFLVKEKCDVLLQNVRRRRIRKRKRSQFYTPS